MTHFLTIAFDHRLQFNDFFRCDLSLDKAIHSINNGQHPDKKIKTDIHNPAIITQLKGEQYLGNKLASLARTCAFDFKRPLLR